MTERSLERPLTRPPAARPAPPASRLAARPVPGPVAAPWWLRGELRGLWDEIQARIGRLPTELNQFGVDPFGYDPRWASNLMFGRGVFYRYYFRVETHGLEQVPEGRVLLVGNHAGNTFAWDGAMVATALFLEGEPPRMVRGMGEYYLPTLPWFGTLMHRLGSVVGTPANCVALLEHEEAVMVFPEGERGFLKPYSQAYELQRFGLGFLRMALETGTPIVPVGVVGSEEHSPGLARVAWLGRLVGAPALPLTVTFPWLGLAGAWPLPSKFHLSFGEPLSFEGDPNDEDAVIERHVDVVKDAIRELVRAGRSRRQTWFT